MRPGMAALVSRLRVVIGDPAGDNQAFDDDELQGFLDERAVHVTALALTPAYPLSGTPTRWSSGGRWWDGDVVLMDGSGGVLTPAAATDLASGRWEFTSGQSAVYATGRSYDLHGSAALALEAWAARVATEFDFAADNQRFDRSQKSVGLLAVARENARRARI